MWRSLIGDTCHSIIGPLMSLFTHTKSYMSSLTRATSYMSLFTRVGLLVSSPTRADA